MVPRFAFTALLLPISLAHAQAPLYAVHEYEIHGTNTIRLANVGVFPRGVLAECQSRLAQLKRGQALYPSSVVTVTKQSTCTTFLPPQFTGIEEGASIENSYVIRVQPTNTAPVYSIWYGLDAPGKKFTCERLLSETRTRMDSRILGQVRLSCVPPKEG